MRARFAPSPTGELHLGNARTALLAWLQARSAGGTFILRVEDLDSGRVRPEYVEGQLTDLRWLGLDWDEGPYFQSHRRGLYDEAIARLEGLGLVYRCFCSRKEIAAAASAPHGPDDEGPVYPGICRELPPGRTGPHALRFRVPEGPVSFRDALQGPQSAQPGDFVIRRRDGVPAYQLAVVVDDIEMGITDVLRGADLITSTARQILLYEALGATPPRWTHVPLILGPDGERLSKRHGAVSLKALREQGRSAAEVVGSLAASCGLAEVGERIEARELIPRFDLDVLPRHPTVWSG